jgi:hypothetical protein
MAMDGRRLRTASGGGQKVIGEIVLEVMQQGIAFSVLQANENILPLVAIDKPKFHP